MIEFRCWYCNRRHNRPTAHVGQKFVCSCEHPLRVPSRSGGNARVFSLGGFLVSRLVYGGGGALLGLLVSLVFMSRLFSRFRFHFTFDCFLFFLPPMLGLLIGALFGESGINWLGQLFRSDGNHRR